jgi:hypothetical protein
MSGINTTALVQTTVANPAVTNGNLTIATTPVPPQPARPGLSELLVLLSKLFELITQMNQPVAPLTKEQIDGAEKTLLEGKLPTDERATREVIKQLFEGTRPNKGIALNARQNDGTYSRVDLKSLTPIGGGVTIINVDLRKNGGALDTAQSLKPWEGKIEGLVIQAPPLPPMPVSKERVDAVAKAVNERKVPADEPALRQYMAEVMGGQRPNEGLVINQRIGANAPYTQVFPAAGSIPTWPVDKGQVNVNVTNEIIQTANGLPGGALRPVYEAKIDSVNVSGIYLPPLTKEQIDGAEKTLLEGKLPTDERATREVIKQLFEGTRPNKGIALNARQNDGTYSRIDLKSLTPIGGRVTIINVDLRKNGGTLDNAQPLNPWEGKIEGLIVQAPPLPPMPTPVTKERVNAAAQAIQRGRTPVDREAVLALALDIQAGKRAVPNVRVVDGGYTDRSFIPGRFTIALKTEFGMAGNSQFAAVRIQDTYFDRTSNNQSFAPDTIVSQAFNSRRRPSTEQLQELVNDMRLEGYNPNVSNSSTSKIFKGVMVSMQPFNKTTQSARVDVLPEGTPVTADFQPNRLRIFVDGSGKVTGSSRG